MRTEDDIRAAFRTLARQAPDADAVLTAVRDQLDDNASAGARQGAPRAARRWMTPLAAAAAVVAVTATAVAIANGQPTHHSGTSAAASSGSGLDRLPRYYMSLAFTGGSGSRATFGAVVKDTVTGATLATFHPPGPSETFLGVAGAADDRTFVLAARKFPPSGDAVAGAPVKLYRAVFHPARASVTLTALPIPQIPAADTFNGLALSPSGSSLAVGIWTSQVRNVRQQVRVYSLPSGAVKVWQQSPTGGPNFRPSFAQSGALAFNWAGAPAPGTWLLRTGTSGGNLTRNSRLAVPAKMGRYSVAGGVLSDDGSIITAVASTALPSRPSGTKIVLVQFRAKIVQFAVQSGRAIRTLWTWRYTGIGPDASVIWSSPSGDVLVVQAWTRNDGHEVIGVLHGSRLTPIPGVPEGIGYPDPIIGEGSVLAF